MPNVLDKLEQEALNFMDKRVRVENSLKIDMAREVHNTMIDVKRYLSSVDKVNLFYISSLIQNNIKSIIDSHKTVAVQMIDDAINNNFEVGINQASKFFNLTDENFSPVQVDENKRQEILLALLLFGRNLITGLYDNLLGDINKDLTSTFILARNQDNGDSTLDITLTGAVLANSIDDSFRKITNRTDTISQTESNRALNHGVLLMYILSKKEIQDLKVKWVEVKDQRLCKYCIERANGGPDGDGVYSIENISPPPLHPNCRCILVPFLYTWFV